MEKILSNYLCFMRVERNATPSTLSTYRRHLEKFIIFLTAQGISFEHCTLSILRNYIFNLQDKNNLAANSVCLEIAILKSFFSYISDENIINSNPTKKIRLPKKRQSVPKLITKPEIEQILNAINFAPARCVKNRIRDTLIICMLYFTGVRRAELLGLNWTDIDLARFVLTIRSGKGRKYRIIPIHQKLQNLLDLYLEQRLPITNYALIIGEQGKRLSKNSLHNILKMYFSLAGLEKKGYSAHSFRHAFASRLVEAGVDIFTVQKLLGHSSLDATKIYISISTQNLASAVEYL